VGTPTPSGRDTGFTHKSLLPLLLCGLVLLVDGYETQAISYALPAIAVEWSLSKAALGPVLSAALVGSMLGFCAAPTLACRIGQKRMTLASMTCFSALILATSFTTSLDQLLALRFLTGLAVGATIPSVIALASAVAPADRRATSIVLIYGCYSIGFALAGLAAATLTASFGWRVLFWLGCIAPLLLLVPVALLIPDAKLSPDSVTLRPLRMASPASDLWLLFTKRPALGTFLIWLSFGLISSEFYFIQSWLPSMLTALHFSLSSLAWITSLSTIGGAVSALFIGAAMDRFNRYRVVAWLFIAAAIFVGLVGVSLDQAIWTLMLAMFFAGFFIGGVLKGMTALAALFYPAPIQPIGSGWALGIARIGGALGPVVVGAVYVAGAGPARIFALAIVPLLLGAVTVMGISKYQGETS
jgi:AAHS family 4-hydroxybenzoate transporter-like MFS transporter